jgi:shikimate dehydrogenase
MTPFAEVIGDPIAQSKSPAIHRFWLDRLGMEADYRACHVTAAGLADYIAARREDPAWRGCNVTMPHKQAVTAQLDRLEIGAELVGAVNTVTRRHNGALIGTNTDVGGFLEPLAGLLGQTHYFRMARVLGTGGAARAILDAIDPEGDHHAADLAHFAAPTDFAFDGRAGCLDLVVNASPLGMRGHPDLAFDWSHAPPGAIAYDIVTDPLDTAFLAAAQEAGHVRIDGLSMLIGQAALAFEKFFGVAPPRAHDAELRAMLAG